MGGGDNKSYQGIGGQQSYEGQKSTDVHHDYDSAKSYQGESTTRTYQNLEGDDSEKETNQ